MTEVAIFEPPQSCASGACSPDAADEMERFEAALERLEARGVAISRFNLGLDPEVFSRHPLVKRTLREQGIGCLPLVLVGDAIVSTGRYPSLQELAASSGISP